MADASAIAEVRANTNVDEDDEEFTTTVISDLLDSVGENVNSASAIIWRRKAAKYAELVDVTEAGSTRALGDLQDKALRMAASFEALAYQAVSGRPRIKTIVRERNDAVTG
jgi:hypothetical protein